MARPATAFVLCLAPLTACTSPCRALAEHAAQCDRASGPYAEPDRSVCEDVRRHVGESSFDEYAHCVTSAPCDDRTAIDRCQSSVWVPSDTDACTRYRLWAAACGLEPVGTADGCAALGATSPGAPTFEAWVSCITAEGCPATDDPRFAACGTTVLPEQPFALLEACSLIGSWTTACAEVSTPIPVEPTPLPTCLTQADPFTADSYLEYARCLSTIACDAFAERIDCLSRLRVSERDQIRAQCANIIAFTSTCGSLAAGGTEEICIRLLARFTPASIDAYGRCLEDGPCEDTTHAITCGQLLALQ